MNPKKHLQHEHGEGADPHASQTGIAANDTRNPLWIVATGLGVLLGIMGAVLMLAS